MEDEEGGAFSPLNFYKTKFLFFLKKRKNETYVCGQAELKQECTIAIYIALAIYTNEF